MRSLAADMVLNRIAPQHFGLESTHSCLSPTTQRTSAIANRVGIGRNSKVGGVRDDADRAVLSNLFPGSTAFRRGAPPVRH